jgi:hypothetical protein
VTFAPAAGRSTTPLIKLAHATLTVNGSLTARQSRKTKAQLVPGSQCGLRKSGRSLGTVVYQILFGNIRSVPTVLEATWSLLDFVGELLVIHSYAYVVPVLASSYTDCCTGTPHSWFYILLGDPSSLFGFCWSSFVAHSYAYQF